MNELHEANRRPTAARIAGGRAETRLLMMNMTIRRYRPGEEEALWCLYHDTTHRILERDYTPEQCERWAPAVADMPQWTERIRARNPFVAERDGLILGFAELEPDGHIDYFYCHHAYQRQGVGRRLYAAIEAEATRLQIPLLHAAVSTNAKAFFLRMGFAVVKEQRNIVCGVVAPNAIMRKELPAHTEPKRTGVAQLERSATRLSSVRVEVRPALDADAEAAVEVLRRSITEVCLADHQNDAPTLERWLRNKTPERFRSWRSAPDNFLVVAVCAGVICGVGAIRQSGDLDLLYVHPSYQRKGIGRALLMVLESRAREWGIPTICLIASATARPFYEHFGYEFLPDESSPGYGVLFDYCYRKSLT
jgi:putative acetyltransferase